MSCLWCRVKPVRGDPDMAAWLVCSEECKSAWKLDVLSKRERNR